MSHRFCSYKYLFYLFLSLPIINCIYFRSKVRSHQCSFYQSPGFIPFNAIKTKHKYAPKKVPRSATRPSHISNEEPPPNAHSGPGPRSRGSALQLSNPIVIPLSKSQFSEIFGTATYVLCCLTCILIQICIFLQA